MKQIKLILLFLVMFLPMMANSDPVEIDGICYNLIAKGKVAEVTRNFGHGYSGNVIIPEKVSYGGSVYDVTSIGGDVSYNGNTYMGGAFRGCTGLTSVIIPNSVTSIGYGAFYQCSGLTSVNIPESVTFIGESAFLGCSGLTSLTIPESATFIGKYAFAGCSGLTSITIPSSWSSIGYGIFGDCTGLTSITIPDNIYNIDDVAFSGCTGLTSITIPNSVNGIGNQAFYGCTSLSSIIIPNSVSYIGNGAFSACRALTSIIIPESVTSIGRGTFARCTSLTSITIPQSVTSIGGDNIYGGAFSGCTSLTSFIIPDRVTSIGNQAFLGCDNLKTVKIGSGVKSIGSYAFMNCPELTDVYCYAVNVPNINTDVFKNSYIEYATLHVSAESIDAYTTANTWKNFKSIVEIDLSKHYLTYIVDGVEYKKYEIDVGDPIIPEPAPTKEDFIFSGWSEIPKTMPDYDVTVTGTFSDGVDAEVKLNKNKATIEKGRTLTLKATVTPETLTDKSVTWKSSNTAVATVTSAGKVKGVKAGTATITCTSTATGAKATCKVTVGYVKLDETEAALEKGKTLTLSATVYPSSLSDKTVTWESSNTAVATVTSAGKVKGVKAGTATITCTSKSTGLKATCAVTVSYVKLDKTEAALEKGKTMTLKATVYPSSLTDKTVTWKSSNTAVATVTSAGKVKGVKAGSVTITSTSKATGLKATCKVTIGYVKLDQTEVTLLKGNTVTLKTTVYPSSLTDKTVTWKSSNTAVATVTSAGKVKGVKAGKATITCTSKATGLKTTCTVTVVNGFVTLNKKEASVQKGKTLTLEAIVTPTSLKDKSVTWESSDTKIATVTSAGKVKGVKYGTATITCTSKSTGAKATCQVTVGKVIISVSEITLMRSRTNMLTATVYPSTLADKSVIWKSSDTKIVTVTDEGKIKGIKAGTATITCTSVATGLKATCTVTVLQNIGSLLEDEDSVEVTGINEIEEPAVAEPFDVYDLNGHKVLSQVTSLDGLPNGIYIVNGKKILKKY